MQSILKPKFVAATLLFVFGSAERVWAFGPGAMSRLGDLIGATLWGIIGIVAGALISFPVRRGSWNRVFLGATIGCVIGVVVSRFV